MVSSQDLRAGAGIWSSSAALQTGTAVRIKKWRKV